MTPELMAAGAKALAEHRSKTGSVIVGEEVYFGQGVALYVDEITVSFDGFRALNKLSLTIDVGELRCIIGPNGAGKTTMMDIITGKTRPDSGKVFFGSNIDLLRLSEPQIAQAGVGRKFQKPTVYEQLSVFENLELALKADRRVRAALFHRLNGEQMDRIGEVLALIHLQDQAQRTAGLLSHGQKQWLEIGMLLAQDPKLLLLDEPVAGMNDVEANEMGAIFRQLVADGMAVLLISADLEELVGLSDTIRVILRGRLSGDFDPDVVTRDQLGAAMTGAAADEGTLR